MNDLVPVEKVKALKADEEIQVAFRAIGTSWVQLAIMLSNFRKHEYWQPLGYDGFNAWLEDRVTESRASCYSKMRLVEDLARHIPLATLQTLPIENCKLLAKVPESKREGMTEKARTLSIVELAKEVLQVKGNSLNGEEEFVHRTYVWTVTQVQIIDAAIDKVLEEYPDWTRSKALEVICAEYSNG